MENILEINYQGRNISIEESAYKALQQYESELKTYFLKEEGGEETFADLQYRMAEILEQKTFISTSAIGMTDIDELISTIGKPSDLDDSSTEEPQPSSSTNTGEKKKLYRNKNKNEKVIAGVCSGIAYYFSIDPIAVRLAFVLFTIFNFATLFSFPLGLVLYIVWWIVLEPAYIKTNLNRKLFRNPKDKVISGVCSGLAQFFNIETWIVRLIFLSPILLGAVTSHSFMGHLGFHSINSNLAGLSFITYVILAFILPLAKSSTDYMLLKGEPINISTIQKPASMDIVAQHGKSGLNKFLKIIAYIILVIFLLSWIPLSFAFLFSAFISYKVASIILFTSLNKMLAIGFISFIIILPLIGMLIWLIRKISGFQKPNRALRVIFSALHIVGWFCLTFLVVNIIKENNYHKHGKTTQYEVNTLSDTLYVEPENADSVYEDRMLFRLNAFEDIIEQTPNENKLKVIGIRYEHTQDSFFTVRVERSAFGATAAQAVANANATVYNVQMIGNKVFLPSMISVDNKVQYHGQIVKVVIGIPKNKTIIVSRLLKKQFKHTLHIDSHNFYFKNHKSDDENDIIGIESNDNSDDDIIQIDDDIIRINDETIKTDEDAKQQIEEAKRDAQQQIDEAKRDLEESNRDAQLKIDEAKRDLEAAKRDAQLKIDEAKRTISK